eukprot:scaffold7510_cov376-Prasinococcus_capsulatus_cf.AAC.1
MSRVHLLRLCHYKLALCLHKIAHTSPCQALHTSPSATPYAHTGGVWRDHLLAAGLGRIEPPAKPGRLTRSIGEPT